MQRDFTQKKRDKERAGPRSPTYSFFEHFHCQEIFDWAPEKFFFPTHRPHPHRLSFLILSAVNTTGKEPPPASPPCPFLFPLSSFRISKQGPSPDRATAIQLLDWNMQRYFTKKRDKECVGQKPNNKLFEHSHCQEIFWLGPRKFFFQHTEPTHINPVSFLIFISNKFFFTFPFVVSACVKYELLDRFPSPHAHSLFFSV